MRVVVPVANFTSTGMIAVMLEMHRNICRVTSGFVSPATVN